jgi:hypothetical protein
MYKVNAVSETVLKTCYNAYIIVGKLINAQKDTSPAEVQVVITKEYQTCGLYSI